MFHSSFLKEILMLSFFIYQIYYQIYYQII